MVQNHKEKTAVTFTLPVELKERLEEHSNDLGITQSGILRMLLNKNLPEKEEVA